MKIRTAVRRIFAGLLMVLAVTCCLRPAVGQAEAKSVTYNAAFEEKIRAVSEKYTYYVATTMTSLNGSGVRVTSKIDLKNRIIRQSRQVTVDGNNVTRTLVMDLAGSRFWQSDGGDFAKLTKNQASSYTSVIRSYDGITNFYQAVQGMGNFMLTRQVEGKVDEGHYVFAVSEKPTAAQLSAAGLKVDVADADVMKTTYYLRTQKNGNIVPYYYKQQFYFWNNGKLNRYVITCKYTSLSKKTALKLPET